MGRSQLKYKKRTSSQHYNLDPDFYFILILFLGKEDSEFTDNIESWESYFRTSVPRLFSSSISPEVSNCSFISKHLLCIFTTWKWFSKYYLN